MRVIHLLLVWLITAFSLYIISRISVLGVEIDNFGDALATSAVFGILNAVLGTILKILTLPLNWLTLGLIYLLINAFIFGLAANFVEGFRIKNGWIGVLLASMALSILNSVLFNLFV